MPNKNKTYLCLLLLLAAFLAAILMFPQTAATQEDLYTLSERTILINDNGFYFQIKSAKKSVAEILLDLNISLRPEDKIYPALSEEAKTQIIIERATPATILADNQTININTFAKTVGQVLEETKISLGENDEVNYPLDHLVFSDMEIAVTRIAFDTLKKNVSIPFETVIKKDENLLWGKTKIVAEGHNGLKEQIFKIVYKDGKEAKRILEQETILEKPQTKIVLEGTKIVVGEPNYGIASFYRYGDALTCASTRFPFGTALRVTNTGSGKNVIVRVNDYGPFVPGRIIDLNVPAFEKIAPLGAGLANVKVEEIIQ